jgi:hypothetical protein
MVPNASIRRQGKDYNGKSCHENFVIKKRDEKPSMKMFSLLSRRAMLLYPANLGHTTGSLKY